MIGCLDGSHNGETFFNRKKDYSLNCMFVCNSQEEILFYTVGSPGFYHDSRVFRRSGLQDLLDELPSDRRVLGMVYITLSPSYVVL